MGSLRTRSRQRFKAVICPAIAFHEPETTLGREIAARGISPLGPFARARVPAQHFLSAVSPVTAFLRRELGTTKVSAHWVLPFSGDAETMLKSKHQWMH
jgi:hypothetical protein